MGISGAYWRGITAGPDDGPGGFQARLPEIVRALQGDAGRSGDVPRVGEHVEEVDPGRDAGRERAEGQMARPRHVGRGPRLPRRPGGRPQRQPVVAADEVAGRRARVIAAARGVAGELQGDADGFDIKPTLTGTLVVTDCPFSGGTVMTRSVPYPARSAWPTSRPSACGRASRWRGRRPGGPRRRMACAFPSARRPRRSFAPWSRSRPGAAPGPPGRSSLSCRGGRARRPFGCRGHRHFARHVPLTDGAPRHAGRRRAGVSLVSAATSRSKAPIWSTLRSKARP